MKLKTLIASLSGLLLCLPALAVNYSGNSNSGFGGPVGLGSLTLTDDGVTLFGTINKGPNGFNDVLVIYIDSVTGGFTDTSSFSDAGDGLRKAISGYDGSNRSLLTFASGFTADYALALGPASDNFGGLWTLASGANGSLNFNSSASLSPTGNNNSPTYTFSISLASIGISPGQSFGIFGSYISNTGYRSDEAVAGSATGVQGYNNFTQTAFATYTVPEPTTLTLAASGLGLLLLIRRRR
jgi:hypothetical protein